MRYKIKRIIFLMFLVFLVNILFSSQVFGERIHAALSVEMDGNETETLLNVSLDSLYVDNLMPEPLSTGENKLILKTIYENGGISEIKEVGFGFYLPGSVLVATATKVFADFNYYSNLRYVKVYYSNMEVLSVDLSKLCNNNMKCEENENFYSCSRDCKWHGQDGLCLGYSGDYYCDSDCYIDEDCGKPNCNDGIQNQDETSVDKGGVCSLGNCYDGIKNGDEKGIDCGGSCYKNCEPPSQYTYSRLNCYSYYYTKWHSGNCKTKACKKDEYVDCEVKKEGRKTYSREVCAKSYYTACSENPSCGNDKEKGREECKLPTTKGKTTGRIIDRIIESLRSVGNAIKERFS